MGSAQEQMVQQAVKLLRAGQQPRALRVLERCRRDEPAGDVNWWLQLASAYAEAGAVDEALTFYERATSWLVAHNAHERAAAALKAMVNLSPDPTLHSRLAAQLQLAGHAKAASRHAQLAARMGDEATIGRRAPAQASMVASSSPASPGPRFSLGVALGATMVAGLQRAIAGLDAPPLVTDLLGAASDHVAGVVQALSAVIP